jgi:hypothetical protein
MSVKLSRRAAIGGTVAACLGAAIGVSLPRREFVTVQPGNWDDPATWKDGAIPPNDGRGTTTFINHVLTVNCWDSRTIENHHFIIGQSPHWRPCHGGLVIA